MPELAIKRVDRLLAAGVVPAIIAVWVVLVGFDVLTHFLRQLSDLGNDGYTLGALLLETFWGVPHRLYDWFGNAALIGALLGLGGMAGSGELTALRAAGMSKFRIVLSTAMTVLALTVAVMAMGETLAPWASRQAQQVRVQSQKLGLVTSSGLWVRDQGDIVNARRALIERQHGQALIRLIDVRIFTLAADGELTRFAHAASATGQGRHWQLQNVRSSSVDESGVRAEVLPERTWRTTLDTALLQRSVVAPDELSTLDLWRNIRSLHRNAQSAADHEQAFWAHVFYPLNVLVLVICALPFVFGSLRSGGLGKRVFIGVVLALAWHFLQQGLVSVGVVYGLGAWLANLLPALVLILAATVYFRRFG